MNQKLQHQVGTVIKIPFNAAFHTPPKYVVGQVLHTFIKKSIKNYDNCRHWKETQARTMMNEYKLQAYNAGFPIGK